MISVVVANGLGNAAAKALHDVSTVIMCSTDIDRTTEAVRSAVSDALGRTQRLTVCNDGSATAKNSQAYVHLKDTHTWIAPGTTVGIRRAPSTAIDLECDYVNLDSQEVTSMLSVDNSMAAVTRAKYRTRGGCSRN